jgi:hypothetical protein
VVRRHRPAYPPAPSRTSRDRHGRGLRSSVAGPHLPFLRSRADAFETTVAATADYLRELWPDELATVRFEIAGLPAKPSGDHVERWWVSAAERRVVLYRLPIERLAHLHRDDELHRRLLTESCVVRAVAELLGRDPWDLAPDRFRHL